MNIASIFNSAYTMPLMTALSGAFDYAKNTGAGNAVVLAAQRKQQGANLAAEQLQINAGQQEAAAQRNAQEQERIGELGLSRLRAIVAMQGGSSNDPSVIGLRARLQSEQAYRMAASLYQGEEAARGMRDQAGAQIYMGEAAVSDARMANRAAQYGAAAGLIKNASKQYADTPKTLLDGYAPKSMYEKYGATDMQGTF